MSMHQYFPRLLSAQHTLIQTLQQQCRRMFDERCRWCHSSISMVGGGYPFPVIAQAIDKTEKPIRRLAEIPQSTWQAMYREGVLCASCLNTLPWCCLQTTCRQCALPISHTSHLCGFCLNDELPSLDTVYAAFTYEDPIKSLMFRFKLLPDNGICRYFAQALLQTMLLPSSPWNASNRLLVDGNTMQYDALLPIPLSAKRMRWRGYHQSLWLAKTFRKFIKQNIPSMKTLKIADDWVRKVRDRGSQKNCLRAERFRNVKGCFIVPEAIKPMVAGGRFLLLDDVMTSGATLNAVAQVLKKQGAQSVSGLVVARATLDS